MRETRTAVGVSTIGWKIEGVVVSQKMCKAEFQMGHHSIQCSHMSSEEGSESDFLPSSPECSRDEAKCFWRMEVW